MWANFPTVNHTIFVSVSSACSHNDFQKFPTLSPVHHLSSNLRALTAYCTLALLRQVKTILGDEPKDVVNCLLIGGRIVVVFDICLYQPSLFQEESSP